MPTVDFQAILIEPTGPSLMDEIVLHATVDSDTSQESEEKTDPMLARELKVTTGILRAMGKEATSVILNARLVQEEDQGEVVMRIIRLIEPLGRL